MDTYNVLWENNNSNDRWPLSGPSGSCRRVVITSAPRNSFLCALFKAQVLNKLCATRTKPNYVHPPLENQQKIIAGGISERARDWKKEKSQQQQQVKDNYTPLVFSSSIILIILICCLVRHPFLIVQSLSHCARLTRSLSALPSIQAVLGMRSSSCSRTPKAF